VTTQPGRPFAVDDEMDEEADPAVSPAYNEERGDAESDVIVAEVIDEEPGSRAGGYEPGGPYSRQQGAPDSYPTSANSTPTTEAATGADPLAAPGHSDAAPLADEAVSPADSESADGELPDDEVSGNELSDDMSPAGPNAAADGLFPADATTGPAGQQGIGALGQQWHDIQAMFVDDPRGSVQLAAEAADAAVCSLVESLRELQNGLRPAAGSASSDPADTEQLRGALRRYRAFCETVRDLAHRLPQVGGVAH
jgi:hypothetical protein